MEVGTFPVVSFVHVLWVQSHQMALHLLVVVTPCQRRALAN
jgi:hypothetical protein